MELMIYVARKGYRNNTKKKWEIKDAKGDGNKEFYITLNYESLCFFLCKTAIAIFFSMIKSKCAMSS